MEKRRGAGFQACCFAGGRRLACRMQLFLKGRRDARLPHFRRLEACTTLLLLLAACTQPAANEPDNKEVEEHRDQWRPREAQSDFLDIGKQAGIEWLSFMPQDQLDYPEYFEGLDRDQKRRLRLAPKGSDEQVLIQFDLPEGSKLWPVDWYGTELMAVDLPTAQEIDARYSLALAAMKERSEEETLLAIAKERYESEGEKLEDWDPQVGYPAIVFSALKARDGNSVHTAFMTLEKADYGYAVSSIAGRTGRWLVICEKEVLSGGVGVRPPRSTNGMMNILEGISIKREIALEGSPKHKCTSTLEEQLAGTLRFPKGTLKLPVSEAMLVRKIGGNSTIQIDGHGAEPWILIRRLDPNPAEGDMRATLRRDTTFIRRVKVPSGRWSAGFVPEGAKLPIVCFDYDDSAAENNVLGILKAGNELLTFEVITRGVRDGDKRRAARQAAVELLAGATGDPATEAPEFEPLIGWNMGTMGQGD